MLPRVILPFLLLPLLYACSSVEPLGDPQMPYPPQRTPQIGDVLHVPTGYFVSEQQMLASVTDARVVYVGETHDNPASHRLELQVLKAMAERYPGKVALGMEMFNRKQQAVLDQWVTGKLSEKTFLKNSGWYDAWRMDFDYYRDILVFARDHRIPVIGLNADKALVRQVGKSPLDELPEDVKAQLPEMDMNDPYQRALVKAIFGGHSHGNSGSDGFMRVQTLWDEMMAESVADFLSSKKGKDMHMVVMAGGNHIRHGFSIPRRVYRRLPHSYVTVGGRELEIPDDKKDRLMNVDVPHFPMPAYDYVAYLNYESLDKEAVRLGILLDEQEGEVKVSGVMPGSVAEAAGVKKEDIIRRFDGKAVKESFDIIYEVKQKRPGDKSTLTIEREGKRQELEVVFQAVSKESHGK